MKNNYVVMMLVVVVAVSWLYCMQVKHPSNMIPRNSEQSGGDGHFYWRTDGYPTKTFCERRNGTPEKPGGTRGMKSPEGELVTGCEKTGGLWYPKCGKGWESGGFGNECDRVQRRG